MMFSSTKSKLATGGIRRKRSSTGFPKPMLLPLLRLTAMMLFYHRMYHVYSFQSMPMPSTLRIAGRPSFVLMSPLRLSSASSTNPSKNGTKPKTKYEIKWYSMYDLLLMYVDREGHANVPKRYKEGGANLGNWLDTQRNLYRAGTLEGTRQEKLESLGVVWKFRSKSKKSWDEMYDILSIYVDQEGHANVPQGYKEGGANLGTWLATQRNLYRAGTLEGTRQEKLESLGVVWEMKSRKSWDEMYDLLSIYVDREGHANAPQAYKEDGANLGTWLATQRNLYRAGALEGDRQEKLESLGVVWEMKPRKSWVDMYDLLLIYADREGHANVPQAYKEDGANLGTWLARQRNLYRAGTLEGDRQEKLESLGVVWEILKIKVR